MCDGNERSQSMFESNQIKSEGKSGFGTRHLQCFMVFLGWACAISTRVNLSMAIVSMVPKRNETRVPEHPVFAWDEQMQGTMLSAYFWGFMASPIPAGQLAEKFGPKIVLAVAIFFCGTVTSLIPFAAIYGGFYWMVSARVLVGLMQGFILPAIALFFSKWVPIPERGRLVVGVLSGNNFGNIVTMATAGVLADSRWGWPSIFYVTGGAAILWALLYSYIGSSSPQDHKTISEFEKEYILSTLPSNASHQSGMKTPWKSIVTSIRVWAMLIGMTSDNWGYFTLLTQTPRYINGVLGFNMKNSGFLSALPFLTSFVVAFMYGGICDALVNKKVLTRTASKKVWNSFATCGPAICMIVLALSETNETLAMFSLITALAMNCAIYLGAYTNHIDLSPNFAGTVMGITMTLAATGSVAAPLYVGYVVNDRTSVAQWRMVFLTSATVFILGNLVFVLFGSAEVQPWNSPAWEQKTTETTSKTNEETRM